MGFYCKWVAVRGFVVGLFFTVVLSYVFDRSCLLLEGVLQVKSTRRRMEGQQTGLTSKPESQRYIALSATGELLSQYSQ